MNQRLDQLTQQYQQLLQQAQATQDRAIHAQHLMEALKLKAEINGLVILIQEAGKMIQQEAIQAQIAELEAKCQQTLDKATELYCSAAQQDELGKPSTKMWDAYNRQQIAYAALNERINALRRALE